MTLDKQKILLNYLISSQNVFSICLPIIKNEYFDVELRNTANFVINYVEKYNALPDIDQIQAETGVKLKKSELTIDKEEYATNEIEKFCKRKGMEIAVMSSVKYIEEEDYGQVESLIKEAVLISLKRDLGLDYFEDPETRLNELAVSEKYQSTGLKTLDRLLGGGLIRKQLIIFSGNSGAGKSITLSNLGLNLMEDGLNVLYISLELSEELVYLRFNGLLTGFDQIGWKYKKEETIEIIKSEKENHGELFIKYMPSGSSVNDFNAYIKEFILQYGYTPDVLVTDYLDIMGTKENYGGDNVFEKDKRASEQLRNLGAEYNMFNLSASQQNRGGIGNLDPDQSHIAGGISKANTADFWFSILLTDNMKQEGVICYKCIKSRTSDGVGKQALNRWNDKSLRISDLEGSNNILTPKLTSSQDIEETHNKNANTLADLTSNLVNI